MVNAARCDCGSAYCYCLPEKQVSHGVCSLGTREGFHTTHNFILGEFLFVDASKQSTNMRN